MYYQFQCQAASDVMMDQAAADKILSAMGITPHTPGIIEPAAMPAAIHHLEAAMGPEGSARPPVLPAEHTDQALPAKEDCVSFRQRAWPLLDMLKRAHAQNVPVIWHR